MYRLTFAKLMKRSLRREGYVVEIDVEGGCSGGEWMCSGYNNLFISDVREVIKRRLVTDSAHSLLTDRIPRVNK